VVAFPARATEEANLPALQAAARESGITVVFGAVHRAGAENFNSAFVIGPDGKLLTRYDQLSAAAPFATGVNTAALWFTVKGVPAVVTLERDALWTEIAELAAVEGARIIVHLDHETETSEPARLQRMQIWANHASFLTFTTTVNDVDSMIWDDLRGMEEISAEYKGRPRIDSGPVEVFSPWSANLVARATANSPLIVATRKIPSATNPHHPNQTSRYNPQMEPWYRIGAKLIHPQ
jgi:predicted amidohydrolase